jgi:hypothetical protein
VPAWSHRTAPLGTRSAAARDAEGGYADMPSLGRAYGTAMALTALRQLALR